MSQWHQIYNQNASNAISNQASAYQHQLDAQRYAMMTQSTPYRPQLKSVDELRAEVTSLEIMLVDARKALAEAIDREPVKGPSPAFMRKYPAVKNAWEELSMLWKTIGDEK